MNDTAALFLIGSSLLAGTVIPGPSFIVVSRAALTGRSKGLLVAFGVALASVFFACLALGGLLALLAQVPSLYLALKLAGGFYLAYLGWRFWRAASKPGAVAGERRPATAVGARRAIGLGAVTQASNPKAALVYASTFAAFLPPESDPTTGALVLLIVFGVAVGWYGSVALLSSTPPVARRYARARSLIDRLAGAMIGAMGVAIVYRSITERP